VTFSLIRGDATSIPLADDSVDLVVTSPPYFGLRSYTDGGEHYDGQIGSEATPQAFLEALWAWTAECRRVLKPSGSMFVNLGDSYSRGSRTTVDGTTDKRRQGDSRVPPCRDIPAKSLMMLPQRYAIGCIDQLGLILRAEIIWSKPNGLPESVTDRVRRSHEQWFHFTKEPRYFSAVDEVREAHDGREPHANAQRGPSGMNRGLGTEKGSLGSVDLARNPLGKLPGSVWTIPTEPLRVPDHLGVDHFAAFPSEWPRRLILGWSPSGVCVACGEGRRPVYDREIVATRGKANRTERDMAADPLVAGTARQHGLGVYGHYELTRTGYACACPDTTAPTRPAVVLDPFSGTGTTAAVAHHLGRHGIGIDLSADYLRLAEWRCNDPALRAKVLRVDKPKAVIDGQLDIFAADVASGDETTVG
jgi:DNA modification methylase